MPVEKITCSVKVGFTETERELISRLARLEGRDPSSYIRFHMRNHLFGIAERVGMVRQDSTEGEWAMSTPAEL